MTQMSETEAPKRRGRPPMGAGKRQNSSFRLAPAVRQRVADSAAAGGRSVSQEIERRVELSFQLEARIAEIEARAAETNTLREDVLGKFREAEELRSANRIAAIRTAGFRILREIDGTPSRVIISIAMLEGEADGFIGEQQINSGKSSGEAA
jgi:hypothetical protein